MLPSSKRLSRSEVTILLSNPQLKVVFNRCGTLKYASFAKATATEAKFTVVTGSKNQKKAVLRNKVRRQIYTLFRSFINEYKDIQKNITEIQGILYVSKQIYDLPYPTLKANIYELLQKSLA